MYYKNVSVRAPAESVQLLIRITSTQTHTISPRLFALLLFFSFPFFSVCLLRSDSSCYRHRFSQLRVKCTFSFSYTPLAVTPNSGGVRFCLISLTEVASCSSVRVGVSSHRCAKSRRKEDIHRATFPKKHSHSFS